MSDALRLRVEAALAAGPAVDHQAGRATVGELLDALERGVCRAAEPDGSGGWRVNAWVKAGILLGFRLGVVHDFSPAGPLTFRDKDLFPPRAVDQLPGVRLVPGGSAVRRGAYLADGVILMPPCYVNVGAHVGERSMIDSHALVGSCAQLGNAVHLSAGAQVGGVLEPPGALPVVIEDGAFIGALAAVLEGVRVGAGAVLGAGVVLTRSTPVYDLVLSQVQRATPEGSLVIPERAVVIAGSRPVSDPWGQGLGLTAAAALIVKRRDPGTDARAALEEALR